MSIENSSYDIEPTSKNNIERYASDLCLFSNYISVRYAAENLLVNEFKMSEADASGLLDYQESNGEFPDVECFEKSVIGAMNLARMHLYCFILGRLEMELSLEAEQSHASTDIEKYADWVQWVMVGLKGGKQNPHKADGCIAGDRGHDAGCDHSEYCVYKFVLNSVEGEIERYSLPVDEVDLANEVSGGEQNYIDNEYARLSIMVRCLRVYGLIDTYREDMYKNSLKTIRNDMLHSQNSI